MWLWEPSPPPDQGSVKVSDNRAYEAQGPLLPVGPSQKNAHTGPLGNVVKVVCPALFVFMGDQKKPKYPSLKE